MTPAARPPRLVATRSRTPAVLPLGDNQYERGSLADFRTSYDASWGRVLDISRPVPGNHDYERFPRKGLTLHPDGYE